MSCTSPNSPFNGGISWPESPSMKRVMRGPEKRARTELTNGRSATEL